MKLTRMAWVAGMLVVPAFLVAGCQDQTAKRSTMNANIQNAKIVLADLKKTFTAGSTVAESTGRDPGGQDSRMAMLAIVVADKLPYMVEKRVTDASLKKTLKTKLGECGDFIDNTLVPKFNEARASKKPEDAKALVPLLDQLDKKLDEVNSLLP